jgi:hypothetical protein
MLATVRLEGGRATAIWSRSHGGRNPMRRCVKMVAAFSGEFVMQPNKYSPGE